MGEGELGGNERETEVYMLMDREIKRGMKNAEIRTDDFTQMD